jgi:hypothetical protein
MSSVSEALAFLTQHAEDVRAQHAELREHSSASASTSGSPDGMRVRTPPSPPSPDATAASESTSSLVGSLPERRGSGAPASLNALGPEPSGAALRMLENHTPFVIPLVAEILSAVAAKNYFVRRQCLRISRTAFFFFFFFFFFCGWGGFVLGVCL